MNCAAARTTPPVHGPSRSTGNVVQVINDWRVLFEGDGGAGVYAIEPRLKPKTRAQCDRWASPIITGARRGLLFRRGLERHLGADAGRVADGEADARTSSLPLQELVPSCAAIHLGARARADQSRFLILVHILDVMFEDEQVRPSLRCSLMLFLSYHSIVRSSSLSRNTRTIGVCASICFL